MTELVWLIAVVVLTATALPLCRVAALRELPVVARLATAFALGQLVTAAVMTVMSATGVHWSRGPLWALVLLGLLLTPWKEFTIGRPITGAIHFAPLMIVLALIAYGAGTGRITCGDLLFFWGPKGQRFFQSGGIDVEFLRFPHYYLMHPDYPPLQPVIYAWASMIAHRFTLWGAVWLTPLYLAATAAIFFGFARESLGSVRAARFAALLAAVLGLGLVIGHAAGAADPLLLLFEVLALSAATFSRERGRWFVTGLALAGAAMTKVEGAAFAVALILAAAIVVRRLRPLLVTAAPPVIALASWIAFARHHQLLDSYARNGKPLLFDRLPLVLSTTIRQVSYGAAYLPWIAAAAPLFTGRRWRRAALPLIVAALSAGYAFYFYLHEPDPTWWIRTSAERVFLTPLAALVIASAAASCLDPAVNHSLESPPDGMVPQGKETERAD